MPEIFGIPSAALFGQLLIGLINGSFYALLSLGLAVIFGLLNIINFTHGAQYMLGAFCAYFLLNRLGVGYWWSLLVVPLAVGAFGVLIERTMLKPLYKLDHLYGLLLTFGLALVIQGLFRNEFGSSGLPYPIAKELTGGRNLGFMFLPNYRAWVVGASLVICLATWFVIERTKLGSYLRAATENPALVQAFGINVPRMITLTYGFGVALAALAGVMAAPIYQVSPQMGADLIIVVFAVVVIGGMGSIMGSIVTGFGLGIIEGLTKVFYPEASNTVIFIIMAIVLLIKPAGLFGPRDEASIHRYRRHGAALRDRAARRLPGVHDEGDVLRALRLRLQPADRLRRAALVRPRHVPRHRGLRRGACRQDLGLPPELAICSAPRAPSSSRSSRACSRSGASASTSR
jgi:branched-chain amino acid transport system permease protein